jgi:hypothetical protein
LSLAAIGVATLVGPSGCERGDEQVPLTSGPPVPEPIVPTASPGGAAPAQTPSWLEQLPDVPVPVGQGERAWATVPSGSTEMGHVAVFTVEAVRAHRARLSDRMGQKVRNVPGAVIHPLGELKNPQPGDVVLCYSWTAPGVLGRIKQISGDKKLVQYDWAGKTKQAVVDHAQAPVRDIAPLAFVGYPKFGSTSKGMLVALSDDRAWVLTGSGHVEVHPRTTIQGLEVQRTAYAVGDRVRAYAWTTGFEPGTIVKVDEPELRYTVKLPGKRAEQRFFFADLVPVP